MSNFKTELQNTTTMQEFLDVVGKHYDLKNCKLGFLAKPQLIANIDKILILVGAKKIK